VTDLDRFKAACVYPGRLDEQAVERELAAFLQALGARQRIVRLRARWRPQENGPLDRNSEGFLEECIRRSRGLLPFRAAGVACAARRLRATLHVDTDLAFPVRAFHVGDDARAALAARQDSDAPAALAGLNRLVDGVNGVGGRHPVLSVAMNLCGGAAALSVARVLCGPLATDPYNAVVAALGAYVDAYVGALGVFVLGLVAVLGAFVFVVYVSLFGFVLGAFVVVLVAVPLNRTIGRAQNFAGFAADPRAHINQYRLGSMWELSWTSCTLFDAVERRDSAVEAWLRPLFEAFVAGCWLLYWTGDTLYWVAKPTVRREPGTQRLHHDAHAALESDIVNLYVWHGTRVPPFVIVRPDLITIGRIDREDNAEVRRVMIERYRHGEEIHGAAAFICDAGGRRLDHDERYGTLWRLDDTPARVIRDSREAAEVRIPGDEAIAMIEVVNRTPELDGSFKRYWLRVQPTMRTAREAVAWTFNMPAEQYAPEIET